MSSEFSRHFDKLRVSERDNVKRYPRTPPHHSRSDAPNAPRRPPAESKRTDRSGMVARSLFQDDSDDEAPSIIIRTQPDSGGMCRQGYSGGMRRPTAVMRAPRPRQPVVDDSESESDEPEIEQCDLCGSDMTDGFITMEIGNHQHSFHVRCMQRRLNVFRSQTFDEQAATSAIRRSAGWNRGELLQSALNAALKRRDTTAFKDSLSRELKRILIREGGNVLEDALEIDRIIDLSLSDGQYAFNSAFKKRFESELDDTIYVDINQRRDLFKRVFKGQMTRFMLRLRGYKEENPEATERELIDMFYSFMMQDVLIWSPEMNHEKKLAVLHLVRSAAGVSTGGILGPVFEKHFFEQYNSLVNHQLDDPVNDTSVELDELDENLGRDRDDGSGMLALAFKKKKDY